MKRDSQISTILSHLAWLEVQIRGQAQGVPDAALAIALQAYNAAVMLRWWFTCPVSYSDMIQIPKDCEAAAAMMEALAKSSRRAVIDLKGANPKSKSRTLKKLSRAIRAAVAGIAPLFRFPKPTAQRLALLERNPDIPQLVQEYLDEQEESGADTDAGMTPDSDSPDAAIHEALAMLACLTSSQAECGVDNSEADLVLLRMAKGFLKTAVDLRAEEQDSPGIQSLKALADAMVADAEGAA